MHKIAIGERSPFCEFHRMNTKSHLLHANDLLWQPRVLLYFYVSFIFLFQAAMSQAAMSQADRHVDHFWS